MESTSPSSAVSRGDRGAVLIEFALVLPLLVVLLLGTITGGLALNEKQQITHATREGARYAASISATQQFVTGTWAENVRTMVVERSNGSLDTSAVCVSVVQGSPAVVVAPAAAHSTAPAGQPCISGQTYPVTATDAGVRVQVTSTKQARIDLGPVPGVPLTLQQDATARLEQPL